jgi:YD repeat-containing protein
MAALSRSVLSKDIDAENAFDPVGNRTASLAIPSYTVNSSNELTSDSNASYTYDNNGNTTSKVNSSGTTNYTWDYENRLSSVTLPNSGGTVTFKYDPFGRRIEKISPTTTSIFVYDGANLVETVNAMLPQISDVGFHASLIAMVSEPRQVFGRNHAEPTDIGERADFRIAQRILAFAPTVDRSRSIWASRCAGIGNLVALSLSSCSVVDFWPVSTLDHAGTGVRIPSGGERKIGDVIRKVHRSFSAEWFCCVPGTQVRDA